MNTKLLGIVTVIIVILIGIFFTSQYLFTNTNLNMFKNKKTVQIKNATFSIEVPKNSEEMQIGLSKKKSIKDNEGMLFVFEEQGYPGFWMKNMNFPIDMIFIKDNKIVTIYNNVPPPQSEDDSLTVYTPDEPADKVLEIKGGLSEKYNFEEGDSVKITL